MILDRCERLRGRIAEKKQLEQSVNQIRSFRKVRDLLTQQRDRLAPLEAVWRTLREAGVLRDPAPAGVVAALVAVQSARDGFRARADSVVDDRSFSPVAFGQAITAAADALEGLLATAWQRYAAGRVPPTNAEVLDALEPAFSREVRVIRQAAAKLDRLRQIPPATMEQFREFEDDVLALQRVWEQLGGGDVPPPVLAFLKDAATPAGAALDLLTDDVRRWLTEHGIVRSFSVRVASPGH